MTQQTSAVSESLTNTTANNSNQGNSEVRHNWQAEEVKALFDMPFNDLMFKAQVIHRANFNPNEVQVSTLLSIKTGACPEDCKYCSQSSRYKTDIDKERLMEVQKARSSTSS